MVWEQRWHPLREEWVVVAAHRQDRPWSGDTVAASTQAELPRHSPECHFCPGNERVSGQRNPDYTGIHVFDNDHPCVGSDAPVDLDVPHPHYRNRPATGIARVACYTPRHDLSLSRLGVDTTHAVLTELATQYRELGARDDVDHVLVFENRGEAVGVSNPHPHCQIYATNFVFRTIANEAATCAKHHAATGRALLQDILDAERADAKRVLTENDSAIAFVPYFARYAYEVFVAPLRPVASLADLSDSERRDLAAALSDVLVRYDNLWQMPFPYVMAFHQAPTDGREHPGFGFHIELHPPLRKPELLKYLAGPEIGGGNFLSDTSPETKAAELGALPSTHYRSDP